MRRTPEALRAARQFRPMGPAPSTAAVAPRCGARHGGHGQADSEGFDQGALLERHIFRQQVQVARGHQQVFGVCARGFEADLFVLGAAAPLAGAAVVALQAADLVIAGDAAADPVLVPGGSRAVHDAAPLVARHQREGHVEAAVEEFEIRHAESRHGGADAHPSGERFGVGEFGQGEPAGRQELDGFHDGTDCTKRARADGSASGESSLFRGESLRLIYLYFPNANR